MDSSFNLSELWYDRIFEPVYDLILGNASWLYGFLLSVVCICRLRSLIHHSRTVLGRLARMDIVCRCLWYAFLMLLAWNGPALEVYYEYVEQHPDWNLAWLLPPNWGLLWVHPFLITLLMVSGMPRQPAGGRLAAACEVAVFILTGTLVLWAVIPQSIAWLVMMFNMLLEWSLRQPHIPPGEMRYGQEVPAAIQLAKQLSLVSVLTCLAGIGLLFPVRRRRRVFPTAIVGGACLLISAALILHVDYSVIDNVSPSFSSFTFTHHPTSRLLALTFVIPGICWIGWWTATRVVDDCDVVCVDSNPRSPVRLVEIACSVILTLCAWLELSRQLVYAARELADSFGFFSWAVTFLCCLRMLRWHMMCFRGSLTVPAQDYYAGLSIALVIRYSGQALVQLGTLALGLYWLIGLQALWPSW